jgi:Family of unknown function (DUF5372)
MKRSPNYLRLPGLQHSLRGFTGLGDVVIHAAARRVRWGRSTTPDPHDRYQRVPVTHPFHPLSGRGFEFVAYRQNWGEDRVRLHDARRHGGRDVKAITPCTTR